MCIVYGTPLFANFEHHDAFLLNGLLFSVDFARKWSAMK